MSPSASAEFHVCENAQTSEDADRMVAFLRPHLGQKILDVGCGEGHLLAALQRAGLQAEGVDATPELVALAAQRGVTVTQDDALTFIRTHGDRFDTFLLVDFVEHVPFDTVASILEALPAGSRCVVQTPNTNSIIGHMFYLQVPSHITPLSPAVLNKMFERASMVVRTHGTAWGGIPWTGLRRRATLFFLEKLFGVTMLPLFVEGANYYVVAEKPARHAQAAGSLRA